MVRDYSKQTAALKRYQQKESLKRSIGFLERGIKGYKEIVTLIDRLEVFNCGDDIEDAIEARFSDLKEVQEELKELEAFKVYLRRVRRIGYPREDNRPLKDILKEDREDKLDRIEEDKIESIRKKLELESLLKPPL